MHVPTRSRAWEWSNPGFPTDYNLAFRIENINFKDVLNTLTRTFFKSIKCKG